MAARDAEAVVPDDREDLVEVITKLTARLEKLDQADASNKEEIFKLRKVLKILSPKLPRSLLTSANRLNTTFHTRGTRKDQVLLNLSCEPVSLHFKVAAQNIQVQPNSSSFLTVTYKPSVDTSDKGRLVLKLNE